MTEANEKKKSRLLIYCEGETEKQYLTTITDALSISSNVSIRKTSACAPMTLLEWAYKDYQWSQVVDKEFPFTEYWIVFDRDHHPNYEDTFKLAEVLEPKPHLVWTNPCIEFWFWLHYCGDRKLLKFDEEEEVSSTRTETELPNDEVEITTVRRVRRTIKPETMLVFLKKYISGYSKVVCPPGLIQHSGTACDNLSKVAQTKNPMLIGSSMPDILLRLAELQDEVYPPKTDASVDSSETKAVVPDSTESEVPTKNLSDVKNSKENELISSKLESASDVVLTTSSYPTYQDVETIGTTEILKKLGPVDPHRSLLEPLKICLRDWAFFRVKVSGLEYPVGALVHLDKFFTQAAVVQLDSKTRDRGNIGIGALKNLRKLITANKNAPTKERADKIAGRLYAIGNLLTFFAQDLGIPEVLKGLSFTKQMPEDDVSSKMSVPEKAATGKLEVSASSDKTLPASTSGESWENEKEVPAGTVADKSNNSDIFVKQVGTNVEHSSHQSSSKTDKKLEEALGALVKVANRFAAVMSGLAAASDSMKAYEMMPGLCDRGGTLQEEAMRIINECTTIVTNEPGKTAG